MTRHLDGLNVWRWIYKIIDERKRTNGRLTQKEMLELAQDEQRHDNAGQPEEDYENEDI